ALLLSFATRRSSDLFVFADEEEDVYSISSPETFIYDTHVEDTERKQLFNENWSFKYGDQSNAELNEYDDSSWETVQIPHDYSLRSEEHTSELQSRFT